MTQLRVFKEGQGGGRSDGDGRAKEGGFHPGPPPFAEVLTGGGSKTLMFCLRASRPALWSACHSAG